MLSQRYKLKILYTYVMEKGIKNTDRLFEEVSKHLINEEDANSAFISDIVKEKREEMEMIVALLTDKERVDRATDFAKSLDAKKNFEGVKRKLATHKRKSRLYSLAKVASGVAAALVVFYFGASAIFEKENIIPEPELVANLPIIKTSTGKTFNITHEGVDIDGLKIKENDNVIVLEESMLHDDENIIAKNSSEVLFNEIQIPSRSSYTLILADSSVVLLNSGSKLRYPAHDNGEVREVHLEGEGYFKVVKSDRPFIVRSGDMSVKVYGTEFNVKMYEDKIETILLSGSVGIKANNGEETMIVPNQLATYYNEKMEILVEDIIPYISWLDNSFKYVEQPLGDVIFDLENWYGVSFSNTEKYKDLSVTMFSSRKSSITNLVSLLEKATGIMIIREGGNEYKLE